MSTVVRYYAGGGKFHETTVYSRKEQEVLWDNDLHRVLHDTRSILDNLDNIPTYSANWNNESRKTIGKPPEKR